ncbi:MarR family winged helix-turn-helix transcriptional regulator [Comamonas sp. UBA7528]|uniref:MarR family winged helix-turn-helix transcriptional regulator n=1 Tax=Comamonas sp. UBA7528 TaxID=1946391 RepID=UPI001B73F3B7|nr:hypothetical protein [Comamonas sp. UBA7528]MBP7354048.1 hypothetical protein [Comamonas sp.]
MSAGALHFGATLHRAQSVLQQRLDERLGDWHGLSLDGYHLLQALEAPPGLTLPALARALLQPAAATLRQVLPMEKTGLLERADGMVRLRPAGRQLLVEARQTVEATYARALQAPGVEADRFAACLPLLEQLSLSVRGMR